jgi:hypothetical protein
LPLTAADFEGLTEDEAAALREAETEEAAELAAKVTDDEKIANAKAEEKPKEKLEAKADAKPKEKAEENAAKKAEAKADAEAKIDDEGGEEDEKPEPKAEAKPEAKAEPSAPQPSRQVMPDWQAPADAEAKLTEITTKRDELADKFDAGELTAKELLAEQRALDKQERDIERALDRAQMAGEMTVAVWEKSTVPAFLDAHAHYRDNPVLLGALDAEVRRQQVAASEAGGDPLDPSILSKADSAIREALGTIGAAPAKEAAKAETTVETEAAKAAAAAEKPAIPPTLGKVPASEINSTDSKYASLDRLADVNPLAFEDAMGKMSESERETYLARSH